MHPLFRRLALCVCAAAGFLGMAAFLHRVLPLHVPEVTPKLNYLRAHLDDYDTVFIGSSRIYHGVSPEVFDATTAAAGKPTHSFNLAVNGMMPPESVEMTRRLLAMHLPRLQRVFLEIAGARGLPAVEDATVRNMYWQNLPALSYELKRARLDYKTGPPKRRTQRAFDDVSRSLTLFARNQLNIGWLIPTPGFLPVHSWGDDVLLGPDHDGYVPERHPLLAPDRAKLLEWTQSMHDGKIEDDRQPDPLNVGDLASLGSFLAQHGTRLILITAPVTTRDYQAWRDAPAGMPLLRFDDPNQHPELYAPDHRLDPDHLNHQGAQIFSKELADAWLANH